MYNVQYADLASGPCRIAINALYHARGNLDFQTTRSLLQGVTAYAQSHFDGPGHYGALDASIIRRAIEILAARADELEQESL